MSFTDFTSLLTFADRDVLGHPLLLIWTLARKVRTQRWKQESLLPASSQCWNDHPALLPLDGQSLYSNIHFSNFLMTVIFMYGCYGQPWKSQNQSSVPLSTVQNCPRKQFLFQTLCHVSRFQWDLNITPEVKYAFILFRLAENRNMVLSWIGARLSAHVLPFFRSWWC